MFEHDVLTVGWMSNDAVRPAPSAATEDHMAQPKVTTSIGLPASSLLRSTCDPWTSSSVAELQ